MMNIYKTKLTLTSTPFKALLIALMGVVAVSIFAPIGANAVSTMPTARWIVPKNPRAVVIVVHGGSWYGENPNLVNSMVPMAEQLSAKSRSVTMNIDYRSGRYSLDHVIQSYDIARQKFPNLPICVSGSSAGGNLALLLATKRPVSCVIAEAPPTNLYTVSESVYNSAVFLLGKENFVAWSPIYQTKRIKVPTMLVSATNDPLVSHTTQAIPFKKKYPKTILVTLQPGDGKGGFVHSKVDSAQFNKARNREASLIIKAAKQYQIAKQQKTVK